MTSTTKRRRWPQGAWMKLRSGKLLAGQMEARNISQYRLAEYVGCSRGFISHLVSGRKTTCKPKLADAIAVILGVDVELLFVPSTSPIGQIEQPIGRKKAAA